MNAAVEIGSPEISEIRGELQVLENRVAMNYEPGGKPLVVVSAEHYRQISAELVTAKTIDRRIEETRLEMTRPLDQSKANIKSFFDGLRLRPKALIQKFTEALDRYDAEQRRIADEARREAEERARQEREFNERRAARAVERGDFDTAEKAQQAAATVSTPVIAPKIPEVKGVATVEVWKYVVEDASILPREYLIPDQVAIGAMVRAKKGDTKIPGVRVYSETSRRGTGR